MRFRLLSLILLLTLLCPASPALGAELTLTFFDVGQGDSSLIVSPAGKTVLIDGGPPEAGRALLDKLRQRGVTTLDLMLLTHPHLDHLGGLATVVRALSVRNYLDPGFSHPSAAYTALLQALAERGVPVKQAALGRKIDLGGGALLTLLGPPTPYLSGTRSDVNANSAVSRLTWNQVAALLPGDAEPETERWLLSQGPPLQAGLLKVAHHGGRYSSTADFLRAVQSRIAVISVGARNDYGHPTREAMDRLTAAGAQIHRTDQEGDITVRTDGTKWSVTAAAVQKAPVPSRETPPAQAGVEYAASRNAKVFHLSSCAAVQRILPKNLVRFPSREAALASGRKPAGDCHP